MACVGGIYNKKCNYYVFIKCNRHCLKGKKGSEFKSNLK